MKRLLIGSIILFWQMITNAQTTNEQLAQSAFNAWAKGENSGNYADFKKLLSDDFILFSHPLLGSFTGKEALNKLTTLISEREVKKNQLTFSEVQKINNTDTCVFLFNSKGTVSGGFPYQGLNAIVLTVKESKLTGFREYFGFVDPNWFK